MSDKSKITGTDLADQKQIFFVGVQCIVMEANRILLGKRINAAGEGSWALPGGHVEFSEIPLETAKRELKEETSLEGFGGIVLPSFITYTTNVPYVHLPVKFSSVKGKPFPPKGEHFSELLFFDIDKLPKPIFEPSSIAIDLILKDRPNYEEIKFFKIDLISIRPEENRNRFYSITYLPAVEYYDVLKTWGKIGPYKHKSLRSQYMTDIEAMKEIEDTIHLRISHDYLLASAIGSIDFNWLVNLFPLESEIRIQSGVITKLVAKDERFREAFLRDESTPKNGTGSNTKIGEQISLLDS